MRESNVFDRIRSWFYRTFTPKKKQETQSEELKRRMCKSCIESGTCPQVCEICAWDTFHDKENKKC